MQDFPPSSQTTPEEQPSSQPTLYENQPSSDPTIQSSSLSKGYDLMQKFSNFLQSSSQDEPSQYGPAYNQNVTLMLFAAHDLTDRGNARRFIQQFGHLVRYVPSWGWLFFDGSRWLLDDAHVLELAASSLDSCYELAASLNRKHTSFCKRILKHIERSSSPLHLTNLLRFAALLPGITMPHSAFNSHPNLVNLLNGTLDLSSCELSPHQPDHYLTQLIPLNYDPQVSSQPWDSFLVRLTDHDPSLQQYLQQAVGYSLTGHTSETACFLLTGPGQRAQHLFLSALRHLFADYSAHTPSLRPKSLTPAHLTARLLTVSTLTNRDYPTLTSLLASEPFSLPSSTSSSLPFSLAPSTSSLPPYRPPAKIWLSLSELPTMPTQFAPLRDRLKLIPISFAISDHDAQQFALSLPSLLPAILNWAVQGALIWPAHGLKTPNCVLDTITSSREDDDLAFFFEHCCSQGETLTVRAHDLYSGYTIWARSQALPLLSECAFGRLLLARGIRRTRDAHGRVYHQLALTHSLDQLASYLANLYPPTRHRPLKT